MLQGKLPAVTNDMLMWGVVYNIVGIVMILLIIVTAFFSHKFFAKKEAGWEGNSFENPWEVWKMISLIVCVATSIIAVFAIPCIILDTVQVYYSPDLWVLEQVMDMGSSGR